MEKLKILELFGGIGACSKALENLGIDYEIVDYVEIDKYAVKSFNAIHNTNFEPQDICKWNKSIEVDFIMHGSPCQDFSTAGKQAGGDKDSGTRSSLMYETVRIVEKLKPKYVVWENVKNLLGKKHKHNFNAYLEIMENLGYKNYYQILNAKDYEIPQNRERVFTISIRNDIKKAFVFPNKKPLQITLKDLLEDEVDEKFYLSDKMIKYISNDNEKWTGNNKESLINKKIASTINTGEGHRRCDASNYICTEVQQNYDLKQRQLCNSLILNNKVKENDVIRHSYSTNRMKEWDKRNIEKNNEVPTLDTRCDCLGVVVNTKNKRQQELAKKINITKEGVYLDFYNQIINENISGTITTRVDASNNTGVYNNLRIRKLTPKECWRLMGFDDNSFEKASKVNSNAQLYKQAGNSIVVNVLMAIFKQLFNKE